MKNILRIGLLVMLTLPLNLFAEDLSKLNTSDRAKKLIEIANIVYKKNKFKDYYVANAKTVIKEEKGLADALPTPKSQGNMFYGGKKGDIYYMVYFVYDRSKIYFDEHYAACVYIWSKNGEPFGIRLGNGIVMPIYNDGSEDIYDEASAPKIYTINYSKDILKYNEGILPTKVKEGTVIQLNLPYTNIVDADGRITNTGFLLDDDSITGYGIILFNEDCEVSDTKGYTNILIAVLGDISIDGTRYEKKGK